MDQFLMYFKIMLEGKFKVFYILEDLSDKAKIVKGIKLKKLCLSLSYAHVLRMKIIEELTFLIIF